MTMEQYYCVADEFANRPVVAVSAGMMQLQLDATAALAVHYV